MVYHTQYGMELNWTIPFFIARIAQRAYPHERLDKNNLQMERKKGGKKNE